MGNPFEPHGPVYVPVVDNGHDGEHKMNEVNSREQSSCRTRAGVIETHSGKVDTFIEGVQAGVLAMEATTVIWTQKHLIAAYVLYAHFSFIVCVETEMTWYVACPFVDSLQQGVSGSLTPFVTSSFQSQSLTAYINVMASVISGVLKLPLAQILHIWGRSQGFALAIGSLVIGLFMMAVCDSVQMFSVAQAFYWYGYRPPRLISQNNTDIWLIGLVTTA
jgi:hypothetical protein